MSKDHSLDRRNFLKTSMVGAAGLALGERSGLAAEPSYPAKSVMEAFELSGFDPRSPGSETFVVAADCHYGMNTGDGLLPIVQEVNAMRPQPAFFLVNGDLALTVSKQFGHRPDARQQETARDELRAFKKHMDLLNVPLKMTLGNHDTHPGEIDPEIFWSVYPDVTPYSSQTLAGVHLLFLNGHSDGNLESKQRTWLNLQVQELSKNGETIVLVHQPALGSIASERGIPIAIHDAFSKYEQPLWLIGGHHHRNFNSLFRLPRTTILQHGIVCSAEGIWGGPEKPGYWIYGLRNGQVQARLFRRLGQGYRVEPAPRRDGGKSLPLPYEDSAGLLWKVFVGEDDETYRVHINAGDVGSWLAYVKEVTYRLPLQGHDEIPRRVGLLGDITGQRGREVFLSSTGKSAWEPVPSIEDQQSLSFFEIPAALRDASELFVKCVCSKEASLSGYSLWS